MKTGKKDRGFSDETEKLDGDEDGGEVRKVTVSGRGSMNKARNVSLVLKRKVVIK